MFRQRNNRPIILFWYQNRFGWHFSKHGHTRTHALSSYSFSAPKSFGHKHTHFMHFGVFPFRQNYLIICILILGNYHILAVFTTTLNTIDLNWIDSFYIDILIGGWSYTRVVYLSPIFWVYATPLLDPVIHSYLNIGLHNYIIHFWHQNRFWDGYCWFCGISQNLAIRTHTLVWVSYTVSTTDNNRRAPGLYDVLFSARTIIIWGIRTPTFGVFPFRQKYFIICIMQTIYIQSRSFYYNS